jgi:[protein-PII] uridylyltransferase
MDSLFPCIDRPRGIRWLLPRLRAELAGGGKAGDLPSAEELAEDPLLLMRSLKGTAERGPGIGPAALAAMKGFVRDRGRALAEDPGAAALFMEILAARNAGMVLPAMLETGLIEQLIPEFSSIRGRTIFDVYHTFTVDLHSIHTVCELRMLEDTQSDVFEWIRDRDVLFFAAFLHDIGKGCGKPHADLGAEAVRPIAERFGFDTHRTDLIAFLVKNHLLMPTPPHAGPDGRKVIEDLAWKTGSPEKLSMLYLLTVSDSRATGPGPGTSGSPPSSGSSTRGP